MTADQVPPARQAINEMIGAWLLDDVLSKVDAGGLALTGEGGFLPELVKAVLERGLQAELTSHLGYEKGDPAGRGSPNSRNGSSAKTVATEVGEVALAVPRDRAANASPIWVSRPRCPGVNRACGVVSPSTFSANVTAGQPTLSPRNRRICTRSTSAIPATAPSRRTR